MEAVGGWREAIAAIGHPELRARKVRKTDSQTIAPSRTPRLSRSSATILTPEDRGESNAA
jgi:hypothetical protein